MNNIIASSTTNLVVTRTSIDLIVARPTVDIVVAGATVDGSPLEDALINSNMVVATFCTHVEAINAVAVVNAFIAIDNDM